MAFNRRSLAPMDEPTDAFYQKVLTLIEKESDGLDDYGMIDALAHAIVALSR